MNSHSLSVLTSISPTTCIHDSKGLSLRENHYVGEQGQAYHHISHCVGHKEMGEARRLKCKGNYQKIINIVSLLFSSLKLVERSSIYLDYEASKHFLFPGWRGTNCCVGSSPSFLFMERHITLYKVSFLENYSQISLPSAFCASNGLFLHLQKDWRIKNTSLLGSRW